jgi:hypothetical protein
VRRSRDHPHPVGCPEPLDGDGDTLQILPSARMRWAERNTES